MAKRKIHKISKHIMLEKDLYLEGGNLSDLILSLQASLDKYSANYDRIYLEKEYYWDYGDTERYCRYNLYGLREETDQEYEVRMQEAEKLKLRQLETERNQYEQLKKKFESKN